ncbi:ABC transporter ATP-binding protein [Pedobacter puniceum]|uniref:ATP-binding cassette domain-containing protein n=1 Tax=Pedobacter puniceum TaxID=2666136 RepID=A0A7K0FI77_9SPHI|nr:ABC transporter ATP-binding protein [Pedobacter puniceum]MRX45689.1 ATP-binding cassette domain-containing protein [Pedobacter puniceum]
MGVAIKVENLSKQYRLGKIGTGSIAHDLNKWWHTVRGKENPYLKIGETNDRSTKGNSDYVWSLKDINFEIEQGDAVGIIGRNGAGKSTLLKILSRVTGPSTGSVKVKGRIASLLEVGTGFHPELSGRENIFLNGAILGMRKAEIKKHFDTIVDFAGVERYIDTPVKRYSSGMYVRLAFAVAAHLESEILIVDEVLAVGDAEFQKKCLGKMNDVSKGEGRTVLFVSHNMASIRNLCSSGIILQNGMVRYSGNIENCIEDYTKLDIENGDYNKKHVIIDDSYRRFFASHERNIDFLSVEILNKSLNNALATNEDIILEIKIKSVKDIDGCRIAVGVNNINDTPCGVHFSEQNIEVKANEVQKLKVIFKDHQLAKGKYYFDFSIGKGNQIEGFKDFDIIHKTIFFEIAYSDIESKQMIPIWHSSWGNINFQNIEITQN